MQIKDVVYFMNRLVDESPLNRLDEEQIGNDRGKIRVSEGTDNSKEKSLVIDRIFDFPLVAIAEASDPLFERLKEPEVVGEHHLSPLQWMPEAKSVISYFLPFSYQIREANRTWGWPSKEWVYGRIEGEDFNEDLRKKLVEYLSGESSEDGKGEGEGALRTLAPALHPDFEVVNLRSNWSERHIAFIAGLGTFSLSKSLITLRGCAGRYGSVITSRNFSSTERRYSSLEEYCNLCMQCIDRCPSGAITEEGKDLSICYRYISEVIMPHYAPRYGCGKCQTAVQCENSLPE